MALDYKISYFIDGDNSTTLPSWGISDCTGYMGYFQKKEFGANPEGEIITKGSHFISARCVHSLDDE